jgi:hypothetical protein
MAVMPFGSWEDEIALGVEFSHHPSLRGLARMAQLGDHVADGAIDGVAPENARIAFSGR